MGDRAGSLKGADGQGSARRAARREQPLQRLLRSLRPVRGLPMWVRYCVTTMIIAGLCGVRAELGGEIGPSPYLLFFPGIFMVAFAFDRGSGLYAALLSTVLVLDLREPGQHSLVSNVGAGIGLVLFCAFGLFTAATIEALRRTVDELGESEETLERDMAMRAAAEAALAESEARFRTTFELAAVGVAMVGLDGSWLGVNPQLCAILSYRPDELKQKSFQDITHPDDLHADFDHVRRLLAGEITSYSTEKRYFRKDGGLVWILLSVAVVRNGGGVPQHFVSVVQDITERKAAEAVLARDRAELERLVEERTAALMRAAEDRRRAEEALRHGEKLQAVGQLTGEIIHDFNNFLQVIGSGVQLLRRETVEDSKRLAILDGMGKAAKNAAGLTGRLLAFARRQSLRPSTFDLNLRLIDMAGMLRQTLANRVTLTTDLGPELWPVRVDPDQFEVAILNLVVNARDAMPSGGTVTIATRNAHLAGSELRGDFVEVTVRDTGLGMSPALLARVFEPFFTTKGPNKGTGLGLAQVQGFVKQSGGDAVIESAPGEGTTVRLRLPRGAEQVPQPREAGGEVADMIVRAAGKCVLVVDDNADVAAFAEAILRELGYTTRRAADASEALAVLEGGTQLDAVFTDVVMPGPMNGLGLARRLRETWPGVAVVLTSGYSEALANSPGPLFWEVLTKPYRLDELGAALDRALASTDRMRSVCAD